MQDIRLELVVWMWSGISQSSTEDAAGGVF